MLLIKIIPILLENQLVFINYCYWPNWHCEAKAMVVLLFGDSVDLVDSARLEFLCTTVEPQKAPRNQAIVTNSSPSLHAATRKSPVPTTQPITKQIQHTKKIARIILYMGTSVREKERGSCPSLPRRICNGAGRWSPAGLHTHRTVERHCWAAGH